MWTQESLRLPWCAGLIPTQLWRVQIIIMTCVDLGGWESCHNGRAWYSITQRFEGENGPPYFVKYLPKCSYFKTIKYYIFILKLDFKKIKFLVEFNIKKITYNLILRISNFIHNSILLKLSFKNNNTIHNSFKTSILC